jgi:hypothetical protein
MDHVNSKNISPVQNAISEEPKPPFTDEEVRNIITFLETLKDIQTDLISRGYTIVDDEFVPPAEKNSTEFF